MPSEPKAVTSEPKATPPAPVPLAEGPGSTEAGMMLSSTTATPVHATATAAQLPMSQSKPYPAIFHIVCSVLCARPGAVESNPKLPLNTLWD